MRKIMLNRESMVNIDPAMPDVLQYVVTQKYFTGTDIQKQLGLNYPRVARMLDNLERYKLVSPAYEKKGDDDKIKRVRKPLVSKRKCDKLLASAKG